MCQILSSLKTERKKGATSLVSSRTIWITIWWNLIMEFLPKSTQKNVSYCSFKVVVCKCGASFRCFSYISRKALDYVIQADVFYAKFNEYNFKIKVKSTKYTSENVWAQVCLNCTSVKLMYSLSTTQYLQLYLKTSSLSVQLFQQNMLLLWNQNLILILFKTHWTFEQAEPQLAKRKCFSHERK